MREIVRNIQNIRKKAGLNVDDRIKLCIQTKSALLRDSIDAFSTTIMSETLASEIVGSLADGFSQDANVDGEQVSISIKKV